MVFSSSVASFEFPPSPPGLFGEEEFSREAESPPCDELVVEELAAWVMLVSLELLLSELTVELSESERFLFFPDTRLLISKEESF